MIVGVRGCGGYALHVITLGVKSDGEFNLSKQSPPTFIFTILGLIETQLVTCNSGRYSQWPGHCRTIT